MGERELNAEGRLRKALFEDLFTALATHEVSVVDKTKFMHALASHLKEEGDRLQAGDFDAKLYEGAVEMRVSLQAAYEAGLQFKGLMERVRVIRLNTNPMWFDPDTWLKAVAEVITKVRQIEDVLRLHVPESVVDRIAALDPKRGK